MLWLIFPFGFPNYDTVYMLVWGDELAHGNWPDTGAPLPPTPHPLAELWGMLLSPFGAVTASDVLRVARQYLETVTTVVLGPPLAR